MAEAKAKVAAARAAQTPAAVKVKLGLLLPSDVIEAEYPDDETMKHIAYGIDCTHLRHALCKPLGICFMELWSRKEGQGAFLKWKGNLTGHGTKTSILRVAAPNLIPNLSAWKLFVS